MPRQRTFRLEDLFSSNEVPSRDPLEPPDELPVEPPPDDTGPIIEIPGEEPEGPDYGGGDTVPGDFPVPDYGGDEGPLDEPTDVPAPAASPTSITAPGSFATPGSSAARPLLPFNYRSLFDPRNMAQGALQPGSRVPTTPANIAPDAGVLGGQSDDAITRALRRMRG